MQKITLKKEMARSSFNHSTRVFVINANNWYNKGDVSNRVGLINSLRKNLGNDVEICIESRTPQEDSRYFAKYGVGVIKSIYNIDKNKESNHFIFLRKIAPVFTLFFCFFLYQIFRYECNTDNKSQQFLRKLLQSDIVISSPGGFLQDYHISQSLLPHLLLVFLAQSLGKPVIIYAQSLGPFKNRFVRFMSKFVLSKVDLITLREDISREYLHLANITNSRTYVTADSTFSFNPPIYSREQFRESILESFEGEKDEANVLVGLSILGDYFLNSRRVSLLEDYVTSLSSLIDYLSEKIGAKTVIIPQVTTRSELSVMEMVVKKVKHKDHVLKIENDMPPEDVMKIIGSMDLLVGSRMHSCIFALMMNVPVLAIEYEHKTLGIMRMLGLEEWVVNVNNLNEELIRKVNKLYLIRKDVSDYISKKLPEVRRMSLLNGSMVLKLPNSVQNSIDCASGSSVHGKN